MVIFLVPPLPATVPVVQLAENPAGSEILLIEIGAEPLLVIVRVAVDVELTRTVPNDILPLRAMVGVPPVPVTAIVLVPEAELELTVMVPP